MLSGRLNCAGLRRIDLRCGSAASTVSLKQNYRRARLSRQLVAILLLVFALACTGCQQGKNGEGKTSLKQTIRSMLPSRKKDTEKEEKVAKIEGGERIERPEKPRKPKIVVYSQKNCPACQELEKMLRTNRVSFRRFDIDKTKAGREFYAAVSCRILPMVTVESDLVCGYQPDQVLKLYDSRMKSPGSKGGQDSYRF